MQYYFTNGHHGTGTPPTVKDEGIQIIFHFKFEPDLLFPFFANFIYFYITAYYCPTFG